MAIEVRSYRNVFELERRIYRIDRLRLNPAGVPVRGVAYFLALLVTAQILARTPVLAMIVDVLPWYVRSLALPLMTAGVFAVVRVEGRPFHLGVSALLRHILSPRRLASFRPCAAAGHRWQMERILILPDGSDGRLRRLNYTGPGAVKVASAYIHKAGGTGLLARLSTRPHLLVQELPGQPPTVPAQVIALDAGVRLQVR